VTYIDQYRAMSAEELCDWAEALFKRAVDEQARCDARMTEVRNIVPSLIERLRQVERKSLPNDQRDIMNEADRLSRQGKIAECFKLRCQVEAMNRPLRRDADGDRQSPDPCRPR
jgi:hypothetical protein